MNLYKVSQKNYDCSKYDQYDALIVAANNEDEARTICPNDYCDGYGWVNVFSSSKENIGELLKVEYIGTTHLDVGVVLASFNAG